MEKPEAFVAAIVVMSLTGNRMEFGGMIRDVEKSGVAVHLPRS